MNQIKRKAYMTNDIVLGATLRENVNVIKRTTKAFETVSARLATGKIVNSAIDNPQNFFAAKALDNRSDDFNRRLDQIGQAINLIREAAIGTEALEKFLDQGEAIVLDSLEKFQAGAIDGALFDVEINTSPPSLQSQILDAAPDVYYPLNDAGGGTAADLGTGGGVNANYNGGIGIGAPLYSNGGTSSVDFNGTNARVDINDSPLINTATHAERTIELVFNADDILTRQTLYEEGGPVNGFNMYVFNNQVHVTGTDQGAWGRNSPAGANNINAPIVAGQTYHLTLRFDQPNNRFEGFLDGVSMGFVPVANAIFPSHSNDIAIGRTRQDAHFDDILASGDGEYFNGRISDVAIYNRALSDSEILSHATSLESSTTIRTENKDYNKLRSQIDQLVLDASYRGINLLNDEDTEVLFNEDGSTGIELNGEDFTTDGLGLLNLEFDSEDNMRQILDSITKARARVRAFGSTLQTKITVLQTREDFTQKLINNHNTGSDDLAVADQNEEGANLLALQTRLSLATTSLSIGAQNNRAIGNLISTGIQA